MTYQPPEIDPGLEIAITWERGPEGVKVTAALGEASVEVTSSYDAVETIPWLVASMPQVLEAAWAAIESEQQQEALQHD